MPGPWEDYQTSGDNKKPWEKYGKRESPEENTIKRSIPQRIAGAIAPYARPAFEYGGALAGGALATPGTFGLGSVVGAGLGYAAGRQGANALDEFAGIKQPSTLSQAAKNAVMDTGQGIAMEMGGQVVDKALTKGAQMLAPQARRLYESTMKIPPSVKKELRDRAVTTGLEQKIPVTEKGLDSVTGKIENLNQQIAKGIDDLTASQKLADTMNRKVGYRTYDENKIDMKSVVSRLDELKQFYRDSAPNPKPYLDAINGYKKDILQARGKEMFANAAQKLKQGIYVLHRKHYGEMKGIDVEMDKAVARGLKEEIVKKFPALGKLNADDSALINLQTFLERAVNRSRNYDIVRLGDQIMSVGGAVAGGAPGAALAGATKHVLGLPGAKSRIAFALNKAGSMQGAPVLARAIAYPAVKALGQADILDNN